MSHKPGSDHIRAVEWACPRCGTPNLAAVDNCLTCGLEHTAVDTIADMFAAVLLVDELLEGLEGGNGTIRCPRCGGRLRFEAGGRRQGKRNRKFWLRIACETPGCLRCMS